MFKFKYEFDSGIGPLPMCRYLQKFKVNVLYADIDDPDQDEIYAGYASFRIAYIDQALNDGYDLEAMLDYDEIVYRLAGNCFDYKMCGLKEDILEYYNNDVFNSNLCMLETIAILPEFRGEKIASKVIKDIVFHFSSGCCIFILQPFPLQFDRSRWESEDWIKQMDLNKFPSDETIAFKQLGNYYESMGFDKISGYEDFLFYNPALSNEKMKAIDLEEW